MAEDGTAKKKKKNMWRREDAPEDKAFTNAPPTKIPDDIEQPEIEKPKTEKPKNEAKDIWKRSENADEEVAPQTTTTTTDMDDHVLELDDHDLHNIKLIEPTWVRAIASGSVNFLLMCIFAVAQGSILFVDQPNWQNISMAINMHLASAAVMTAILSSQSKIPIFIAGPDLTSSLLLGDSVSKISNHVAQKLQLGVPVPELVTTTQSPMSQVARRLLFDFDSDDPEAQDPSSNPFYLSEERFVPAGDLWLGMEQAKLRTLRATSEILQDMFGFASSHRDESSFDDVAAINDFPIYTATFEDGNRSSNEAVQDRRLDATQTTTTTDGHRRRRRTTSTTTTVYPMPTTDNSKFCREGHLEAYPDLCADYHKGVRCTTVSLCMIMCLLVGLILTFLGHMHHVRFVEFVPRGISDAFSACMGIKTFSKAFKTCLMLPKMFVPAMLLGVPMYFVLTHRMGNPAITMPFFIALPYGAFTAQLQVTGKTTEQAREEELFLPYVPDEMPWNLYEDLLQVKHIHWDAWRQVYGDMGVLIALVVLDSISTGLRMSEDSMPLKISKDYETRLAGLANLALIPLAGVPGFAQYRLNICNFGTQLNVVDRRASIIFAVLCFLTVLAPKQAFLSHLPRNCFAVVLFCGGAGYIAEHLWGSRKYLSFPEWTQIIAIVGMFAGWDSVPYAVVLGGFLTGFQFISKYAKVPCIDGVPLHGGEIASRERHSPLMTRALTHIANNWVVVIKLQGYVFFAAVSYVTHHIRDIMDKQEEENLPRYRKLKYVIIDCSQLNGMDCSASKDLERLRGEAMHHGMNVLWATLQPDLLDDLVTRGVIQSENDCFYDLYEAMLYVEQHIRVFRHRIEERWVNLHPMFKQAQELIRMRENFEPFRFIFPFDAARFGCPWMYCSKRNIKAFKTVLWEDNMVERDLFLIHTGAIGIFDALPAESEEWKPPTAIYKHGWFVNRQFIFREPTEKNAVAMEDGEVLCWNTHQWWKMVREQPLMASAIMEAAMRQMSFDCSVVNSLLALAHRVDIDDEGEIDLSHMDLDEGAISPHDIPNDLAHKIEGLEAAQFLKEFKLYEPIESDAIATALPEMPRKIRDDLAIAFWTYAVEDGEGNYSVPAHKVKEALMYAGIFNMLAATVAEQPLEEKDFIAVGHETALTRLSKKQVAKIYNIFKSYDKDKSGHLDRDEMIIVFRETFHPNISEDEVNGICGAWDDDGSGQIDAKEFVGILSRFIRKHEPDWNLLLGFREILRKTKKEKITHKDHVTVQHLTSSKYFKLTEEEAEEMLWACDCFDLAGDGKELDLAGLVAAVMLSTEYKFGRLPPRPKKPPLKGQRGPQEVADSRELKKINGKYKKPRKSNRNGEPEYAPEGSDPYDGAEEGFNSSSRKHLADDDEKLRQDAQHLPPTKMLKNGVMPVRTKAENQELPNTLPSRMRTLFEYPQSSRCAQIYSVFMVLLIILSFLKPAIEVIAEASSPLAFCPKHFPYAYYSGMTWCCATNREKIGTNQGRSCDGSEFHAGGILSKCCKDGMQVKCDTPPCANWQVPSTTNADAIAVLINIVFTVEYLVRLWVCPAHGDQTYVEFLLHPLNLCDIGSVLPFYYALVTGSGDSTFYRMMRLPRVFKLTKNAKLQKVGKRAGIGVPIMVTNFVIMGSYYRAYNNVNT